MYQSPNPVRRRRRRRRRLRPQFIFTIGCLTLILAVLIAFGIALGQGDSEPIPTEPQETQSTTQATEPPTEPPTTEPPTEPLPTTPMEGLEAFAAEHNLTLEDYPQKILDLYERNEEAREFAMNYPLEYGKDHEIDISGYEDYEGVPLFIQWDKQWGYKDYIGSVGGLSACGPTSLSMIMYYFTRDPEMTPAYMMEFAEKNGYGLKGSGTQWSLFSQGAEKLGLNKKELNSDQMKSEKQIAKVLESGRIIAMNVKPGVFTTVGHYLLIVGYEDGKFKINDPNSYANSEKLWELEEFVDDVRIMWAFSM